MLTISHGEGVWFGKQSHGKFETNVPMVKHWITYKHLHIEIFRSVRSSKTWNPTDKQTNKLTVSFV